MVALFCLAAFGAAGLSLLADDAQADMAFRGLLVLVLVAFLVWWIVGTIASIFAPKGPLRPRYRRPGKGGMPDAERMRGDIKIAMMALLDTERSAAPGAKVRPRAEWLVAEVLADRMAKLRGRKPEKLGTRIDRLAPRQLAETWALHALLTAAPDARETARARYRRPEAYAGLVAQIDAVRDERRTYEAELQVWREATARWERTASVDPGAGGLLGFLQREAADDPALWHAVMCGLEPPVALDLLRWLLAQPKLNAGSLAVWLGQEAALGFLSETVLRAARAGDGSLEALRAAIERWNAGGFAGPVWLTTEEPPEPDVMGYWRREMDRVEARLGHVPLPDPVGLFDAPHAAPPEPRGPYRYSHRDGLTTPPLRPEDYFTHLRG